MQGQVYRTAGSQVVDAYRHYQRPGQTPYPRDTVGDGYGLRPGQRQYHPNEMLQPRHRPSLRKSWHDKKNLLRSMSPFGHLPGWNLKSFIVKSGDDLRKEEAAMQVIEYCQKIFHESELDIYLRPYQIVSTGHQTGFIEFLERAQSITSIKKQFQFGQAESETADAEGTGMREFFEMCFGNSYSIQYSNAISNFVKSLVGYSLITYLLQVKDRHNGNILLDDQGHIVHIDFGFILGDSPGFNINWESAPFKFTNEYLQLLGGVESVWFKQFEELFIRGFECLQRHAGEIATIVHLFYGENRKGAAESIHARLVFPTSQLDIQKLIGESLDNWRTKQYDWYQKTNGIIP